MSELPTRESLTVELKSNRKKLPDRELVLAAVCLANTEGGTIWLGRGAGPGTKLGPFDAWSDRAYSATNRARPFINQARPFLARMIEAHAANANI